MQIYSGYKTITPIQLANVIWALDQRHITHHGLRVYFAGFAMIAVREAAGRYRRKRREASRALSCFRLSELATLTGLDPAKVRRALRELAQAGLMTFSQGEVSVARATLPGSEQLQEILSCQRTPRRPIPIPRSLLRFISKNPSESMARVAIAYAVRGLSITRGTGIISSKGTVKASWIAKTFGISQRAVRYAQAELRSLGWVCKDTLSGQRKLNRDGAYFVINLSWRSGVASRDGAPLPDQNPLVNRDKGLTILAPPTACFAPLFAPPKEDRETSIERNQDQKARVHEPARGVCFKEEGKLPPPRLKHILPQDLCRFGRLEPLYFEAVERGWIAPSEAMALNFVAAAVRAREVGHDPARVFVTLIRRQLWKHITQGQEERARRALTRFREENPDRLRYQKGALRAGVWTTPFPSAGLSQLGVCR